MNDYDRIAQVIEFINANFDEQPDLDTLAEHVGLSSHHFHRLFSRWAGVTPKTFLRCLTLDHAKELLKEGRNVLDTTFEVGLSSPGRLHDLCVDLEAASPGELQSGGAELTIEYGFVQTPFGEALIAQCDRGICHLAFIDDQTEALSHLQENWPQATLVANEAALKKRAIHIFKASSSTVPIKAFVQGTDMQIKVWRALLQIPSGALTTYGDLANHIGHAGAARATGTAIGANPLAYLIPCHRVIRATGKLGGYRWELSRKQALIACESAIRQTV